MTAPLTIRLTERRPAVRRVPPADLADLLARFPHAVDAAPTGTPGRYRLTTRGYAGWFRTPARLWIVRPKLAWADLARIVGPRTLDTARSLASSTIFTPNSSPFFDLIAARLADLMAERAAGGLVRGYAEREQDSPVVRGRIDFAKHSRRPYPPGGLFPVVADEFTPDLPWNRVPAAAARRLLDTPGLSPTVRAKLLAARESFAGVGDDPPTAADLAGLTFDARTEPYRPLIGWAKLVLGDGTGPADSLLLNLDHLFQLHVGNVLADPRVLAQVAVPLPADRGGPPLTLRPDFVAHDAAGRPRSVWDAKWKRLADGPDPADVQQVLAYAAVLGVTVAGLVYPGRRFRVCTHSAGPIRLHLATLRVCGPAEKCDRAVAKLRRLLSS